MSNHERELVYIMITRLNDKQKKELCRQEYCIVSNYFNQFDDGLTGITRSKRVILKTNTQGFSTRDEAIYEMKRLGLEPKRVVKGESNKGFGSVGYIKQTVEVHTIEYALDNYSEYNYEVQRS